MHDTARVHGSARARNDAHRSKARRSADGWSEEGARAPQAFARDRRKSRETERTGGCPLGNILANLDQNEAPFPPVLRVSLHDGVSRRPRAGEKIEDQIIAAHVANLEERPDELDRLRVAEDVLRAEEIRPGGHWPLVVPEGFGGPPVRGALSFALALRTEVLLSRRASTRPGGEDDPPVGEGARYVDSSPIQVSSRTAPEGVVIA